MSRPINPWKDFASYKSSDARYFKGREESIAKFLRIVDADTMSVLYASSGIGKTSFIQAGIVPVMIEKGYAPIHILFTDDDFAEGADLSMILKLHVEDEIKKHNENEDRTRDEKKEQKEDYTTDKWEWHSLLGVRPDETEQVIQGLDEKSLWWKFHACEIRTESGQSLKPLLLLDQFEEVFVKAKTKNVLLQTFFDEFEELASNSLPSEVESVLNQLADQGIFFDLDTNHHYKIIFSLRREYLSDFDYWTNDRHSIAELQQNRMLLLPLSRTKALKVIKEQPLNSEGSDCYTTLNNIAENILNVIDDKQRNEIEPFILSVLCSRLYDRAVGLGKTELKSEDLNTYSANTIIREFYEQKIQSIIPKHSHITRIEEELIDEDGKRGRVKVKRLKDIEFEKRYKRELEDAHLVRIDSYNGEDYIELVHDRVADAIMERRKESTKKNRLIFARIASFVAIVILFFITYWIQTIPTPNKQFPYQLKYEDKGGNYVNFTGDSIHGEKIVAINCHNLKTIVVDSCFSATIKVRGCKDLRNVFMSEYCGDVVLDLDYCPLLNPIQIPSSVYGLSFANIPPNNLSFHTEEKGRYVWKDNILWDKRDATIIYARYDASINVTPPFNTGKNSFAYLLHRFNNEERDTITLTGSDSKYSIIKDSIRVPRNIEFLDLHAFNISYPYNWDMSKFPNLREVILPDSLVEVSRSIFAKCENLRHVTFPSSLREISPNAFSGCMSLQEVVFPDSLKFIGKYAFEGCSSLIEVSLPDSIRVDISSFDGCSNLKVVKLPHFFRPECSTYPDFMFKKCPNISKFYINNRSNRYSVESDSTIVYSGVFMNSEIPLLPLLFINTVKKHSYNSGEFCIVDTLPPYSFYSRDGILFFGYKHWSNVINNPQNNIFLNTKVVNVPEGKEIVYVPLTYREVYLTGALENCKELHFSYTDKSKIRIINLPKELKRNIRLYVPYGALPYFTEIEGFNASEWKSIDEESFYSWICIICRYHFDTGLEVVGQWGWFWPIIIVVVLLIAALITYLYRRKEVGSHTSSSDMIRFIANFAMTIVIGVFTWYTFYWLLFLTAARFMAKISILQTLVSAAVATILAIIFVYIALYSKGFNLKGFMNACKRNFHALWSGLVDAYFAMRHITWKSAVNCGKEIFANIRFIVRTIMLACLRFILLSKKSLLHVFTYMTYPLFKRIGICLLLIGLPILIVRYCTNKSYEDKMRDEIQNYYNSISKSDDINDEQLRKNLIRSMTFPGIKSEFSGNSIFRRLGDSLFIIMDADSCYYIDFANRHSGNMRFGNSIQISENFFYLSDSKRFVSYKTKDSIYIWPITCLGQDPVISVPCMKNYNESVAWHSNDNYVFVQTQSNICKVFNTHTGKLFKEFYIKGIMKGNMIKDFLLCQDSVECSLYSLTSGKLMDSKQTSRQFKINAYKTYAYSHGADSIYILRVHNQKIVFDSIPSARWSSDNYIFANYILFERNDTSYIYNVSQREMTLFERTDLIADNSSHLIALYKNNITEIYTMRDSLKLLARTEYSPYRRRISYNIVALGDSLYYNDTDSLIKLEIQKYDYYDLKTNEDYGIIINNRYYSLDDIDAGSHEFPPNMSSPILRGGWCFLLSDDNRYKLNNLKPTKLLIKESLFLSEEQKMNLIKLIEEREKRKEI